jgi:tetratricopeptide (TPR) repeat protein
MIKSVRLVCFFAVFFHGAFLYAQNSQTLPNSFYVFRDAVCIYAEYQRCPNRKLYTAAREEIEQALAGANLYIALSRCAYLAGVTFQAEGRKNEAAAYYDQGIAWAEDSISLSPTSEGYQYLAANIALSCWVRPRSYVLANIGKIEDNAEKALDLDPQNLAAKYIIAAKYIQAPWPIGNMKRGTNLLREIINQDMNSLEKEDMVNIYLAMAAVCQKEKKPDEERIWQGKALALYPTNRFRETLLRSIGK